MRLRAAAALFCLLYSASDACKDRIAVDPLTMTVDTTDADRITELWKRSDRVLDADLLGGEYLGKAGAGLQIFKRDRAGSPRELAVYIAGNRADHQRAIDKCLAAVRQATPELHSIYPALEGLYHDRPLPPVHVVSGSGDIGGTATAEAQVLGLEVICKTAPDAAALREKPRFFFVHETVHTGQPAFTDAAPNVRLRMVFAESAADDIASLVPGTPPQQKHQAFAQSREAELWRTFMADVERAWPLTGDPMQADPATMAAVLRWLRNYDAAPAGWPDELGYWIGICSRQRYVDRAPDKRTANENVLRWTDAAKKLARGANAPASG